MKRWNLVSTLLQSKKTKNSKCVRWLFLVKTMVYYRLSVKGWIVYMSIHSNSGKKLFESPFWTFLKDLAFLILVTFSVLRCMTRGVLQLTAMRIILPVVILASNLPMLDEVGEPAQKMHEMMRGRPAAQSRQTIWLRSSQCLKTSPRSCWRSKTPWQSSQ